MRKIYTCQKGPTMLSDASVHPSIGLYRKAAAAVAVKYAGRFAASETSVAAAAA